MKEVSAFSFLLDVPPPSLPVLYMVRFLRTHSCPLAVGILVLSYIPGKNYFHGFHYHQLLQDTDFCINSESPLHSVPVGRMPSK